MSLHNGEVVFQDAIVLSKILDEKPNRPFEMLIDFLGMTLILFPLHIFPKLVSDMLRGLAFTQVVFIVIHSYDPADEPLFIPVFGHDPSEPNHSIEKNVSFRVKIF